MLKTMIRDSIGTKILEYYEIFEIMWDYLRYQILDIENFELLEKSEKNPDFSSIFSISDIREFFAKRKI